jgi:hypothetical protein
MDAEPTCKACGFSYVIGLKEDEERHARFHDEEEYGPMSYMNDGIYIVSLENTQPLRHMAEQAFRVGNREAQYDFALFMADEKSTNQPIAAIDTIGGHAIAGVLTRNRSCEYRTSLEEFELCALGGRWRPKRGEAIEPHNRRAIEFIWVHKKYRGEKVLDGCLAKLTEHIGHPISEFSHSLPFTEAAVKFWRKRSLGSIYIAQSWTEHLGDAQDAHLEACVRLLSER